MLLLALLEWPYLKDHQAARMDVKRTLWIASVIVTVARVGQSTTMGLDARIHANQ
jgi:hypothetical protein